MNRLDTALHRIARWIGVEDIPVVHELETQDIRIDPETIARGKRIAAMHEAACEELHEASAQTVAMAKRATNVG